MDWKNGISLEGGGMRSREGEGRKKKRKHKVRCGWQGTVLYITGDGMSKITLSCDRVCVMMMMLGIFAKR